MLAALLAMAGHASAQGAGWTRLFDGHSLAGWIKVGGGEPGYVVKDGLLVCPADGGYGDLYTEKEYSDFIFRFEFMCDKGGNNGVSIRSSMKGSGTYDGGQELQILDDYDPMYANLEPGQYCCGVYKFIAPKRNVVRHAGEWNQEEVTLIGRHIKIRLNGQVVVDADFNKVTDPEVLTQHAGLLRDRGHIGFLGHGPATVSFRNIWIKDLSKPEKDNVPPPGFTALFDGKTLKGWKALVADPPTRAKMTPEQLAEATAKANVEAFKHWTVKDGCITYDGKNNSLCTVKDYGDFELLVDWKIEPGGDSGIYLRGSPQVQIWDNPIGSGGLYNNQKNPSNPIEFADNPPGQWNRFRILMVGDKVTVHLNNKLVVNAVTMENYWERDKPIYPTGQIELQHHGSNLWFKNIYIREIPRKQ
jgi:hypothetical protein